MRFTIILFPWQKYNYFQYARNFATLFYFPSSVHCSHCRKTVSVAHRVHQSATHRYFAPMQCVSVYFIEEYRYLDLSEVYLSFLHHHYIGLTQSSEKDIGQRKYKVTV